MKHITEITQDFKDDLIERVQKADSIIISSHISPDDDSISSVLAVYYYLVEFQKKKNVQIVYTGAQVDGWKYFKNYDQVVFVEDLAGYVSDIDLLILLDGSGWKRFSREKMPDNLRGKVVCIDHHPNPEDLFNLHLVAPQYPAASEIVYRIFYEKEKLDKDIAEILLMGITGDTGNFRYLKSEQAETLLIAHRLIVEGNVYLDDLKTKYEAKTEKVFNSLAELMKNVEIISVENWPKCMTTFIDREYAKSHDLDDNEIKEASNMFTQYLRSVENVTWGFILIPRNDSATNISFRSSPESVNVSAVAAIFGGGGHVRASGGRLEEIDVLKAKSKIIDWMNKNKPILE